MANDSQKKLEQRNTESIALMKRVLLIYWIIYLVVRALLFKFLALSQIILSIVVFLLTRFIVAFFVKMARPKYND